MFTKKDTIYSSALEKVERFVFNKEVAEVFDDMIHRSVPGYDAIIAMVGALAATYAESGSKIFDLGCSLGAATEAMSSNVSPDIEIMAVDNSQAMLDKCRLRMQKTSPHNPIQFVCSNIQDVPIKNASFVVLNFTLQFIAPLERKAMLQKIYEGMNPGGVLIISEKIAFDDPKEQALQSRLHEEFKRLNGYSELEIAQKRAALEDVLIPETLKTHSDRLYEIGFKHVSNWFQSFNFASLLAFK